MGGFLASRRPGLVAGDPGPDHRPWPLFASAAGALGVLDACLTLTEGDLPVQLYAFCLLWLPLMLVFGIAMVVYRDIPESTEPPSTS